jgi:hypothetical protein
MRRLLLVWLVVSAAAVFADDKPAEVPKAPATVDESPEHKHARIEYERWRSTFNDLSVRCTFLMDEGTKLRKLTDEAYQAGDRDKLETVTKQRIANLELTKQLLPLAERAEQQMSQLEQRLKHADECAKMYSQTIDQKTSDLPVRQTELVKACQSMSLYPPEKYQQPSAAHGPS